MLDIVPVRHHAADTLSDRPWRSVALPVDLPEVPAMISPDEQRLLYWLAREYVREGAIVDAGCFLGGSTVPLLAGLRDRASGWAGPPVHSYDLFEADSYMVDDYLADRDIEVGASYRHLFDANVAGFDVPLEVHEGDIREIGWRGGPIELLFLDCLKAWDVNDAVVHAFFGHLVPGRTVIVQQDYAWGELPWIHITMELLADHIRLLAEVPVSTHLYLLERPVPDGILSVSIEHDLGTRRRLKLMDRAAGRLQGESAALVELAKALVIFDGYGPTLAHRHVRRMRQRAGWFESVRVCADRAEGYIPAWPWWHLPSWASWLRWRLRGRPR